MLKLTIGLEVLAVESHVERHDAATKDAMNAKLPSIEGWIWTHVKCWLWLNEMTTCLRFNCRGVQARSVTEPRITQGGFLIPFRNLPFSEEGQDLLYRTSLLANHSLCSGGGPRLAI